MGADQVEVRNVNVPGYRHRVNAEKYHAMRAALLQVLPRQAPGLTQAEMGAAVRTVVTRALFPGGTHLWWMKTVQLDLEARRVLRRDAQAKPLRWSRTR